MSEKKKSGKLKIQSPLAAQKLKTAEETSNVQPAKAGRKPKPVNEKQSEPITLKFTPSEFQIISEMSGDVANATFLKKRLIESGLFED